MWAVAIIAKIFSAKYYQHYPIYLLPWQPAQESNHVKGYTDTGPEVHAARCVDYPG
jgi:hypothetical protein